MTAADSPQLPPSRSHRFQSTRWSVVLSAGKEPSPDSAAAMATLCETYWYPVYAWARRRGHSPDDARDLTQEFFASMLENKFLQSADAERGKFRSFLLTVFQRFIAHERVRAARQKRGGGRLHLSLDFQDGERRFTIEPCVEQTAEQLYDREWAMTLLSRVVVRLRAEYEARGKATLFDALHTCLAPGAEPLEYHAVAAELGISDGALRVAIHRLRSRYRALLREEVAGTIDDTLSIDEELQLLRSALSA